MNDYKLDKIGKHDNNLLKQKINEANEQQTVIDNILGIYYEEVCVDGKGLVWDLEGIEIDKVKLVISRNILKEEIYFINSDNGFGIYVGDDDPANYTLSCDVGTFTSGVYVRKKEGPLKDYVFGVTDCVFVPQSGNSKIKDAIRCEYNQDTGYEITINSIKLIVKVCKYRKYALAKYFEIKIGDKLFSTKGDVLE